MSIAVIDSLSQKYRMIWNDLKPVFPLMLPCHQLISKLLISMITYKITTYNYESYEVPKQKPPIILNYNKLLPITTTTKDK